MHIRMDQPVVRMNMVTRMALMNMLGMDTYIITNEYRQT